MYSRNVAGETLTFGVSGKLWHGVLVMFDRETESYWTQLDGRAIRGEELGQRLEHVPSVFTTWERWRNEHPDTLVLVKAEDEREQLASHYADYFSDPDRLFLDHLGEDLGGIGAKDVVFGVVVDGEPLAVSEDLLASKGIVNAVVGGVPIAFLYKAATGAVYAVDRRLEGRVLLPELHGSDDPARLFRDVLTGEVHGPDELTELRVDRAYWYAWSRSHRGSGILAD